MPELPEVESTRRILEATIVGNVIATVEVYRPTVLRGLRPRAFAHTLVDAQIAGVRRLGKALLIDLRTGWILVFRFMLWGILRIRRTEATPDDRTAAMVRFRDGSSLEFRELQLSTLELVREPSLRARAFFARMGVDPLTPAFTRAWFATMLRTPGSIRAILCDQERVAGIGNLWAHEILHAARLRPSRRANSLTATEAYQLYETVRQVLKHAIRRGGEPDFVDPRGRHGRSELAVYGRSGQRCPRGDGIVRGARLGGRPSFFCPSCQR